MTVWGGVTEKGQVFLEQMPPLAALPVLDHPLAGQRRFQRPHHIGMGGEEAGIAFAVGQVEIGERRVHPVMRFACRCAQGLAGWRQAKTRSKIVSTCLK